MDVLSRSLDVGPRSQSSSRVDGLLGTVVSGRPNFGMFGFPASISWLAACS